MTPLLNFLARLGNLRCWFGYHKPAGWGREHCVRCGKILDWSGVPQIVPCSECGGTGKVGNLIDPNDPEKYACPICGGSGKLVKET